MITAELPQQLSVNKPHMAIATQNKQNIQKHASNMFSGAEAEKLKHVKRSM